MQGQPKGSPVPRLGAWVLRLILRDEDACEGLLGDLMEDCQDELGPDVGGARRWRWYWASILPLAGRFLLSGGWRGTAGPMRAGGTGRVRWEEGTMMDGIRGGVVRVARALRKSPRFTAVTVLILAVGMGGTTALFSLLNNVILRPLPYDEPDRLVGVWLKSPQLGMEWLNESPATYFAFRDESRTFEDIGLWDDRNLTVTGAGEAERVLGMMVSDGLFGVLRAKPILGRAFAPDDDVPGAPLTLVLGYGYWQRRFGGDPAVVGSTLTVNGEVGEIIGIAPPGFKVLRFAPDIYYPARFDRSRVGVGDFSYQAIGRLRPETTLEDATADLARIIPLAVERFPSGWSLEQVRNAKLQPHLRPLHEELTGNLSTAIWFLFGAVGLVLAIACANVANLLLVRGEARAPEVAIRMALGASRGQIIRESLIESLCLGLLAGALGLPLAVLGLNTLRSFLPQQFPRLQEVGLDPTVLVFALATSLAASLLFGTLPALRSGRTSTLAGLKVSGRGGSASRRQARSRDTLVVFQVALAFVLLVAAGLMTRSFAALQNLDPGFADPEQVLTFRVELPPSQASTTLDVAAFYENLIHRMEELPGVESVSGSNSLPMDGADSNQGLPIEDFPVAAGDNPPAARVKWVAGNYFKTLRIPVLLGRGITWDDAREQAHVVVVNEAYARRHWGEARRALGRRIRHPGMPWREIVGVVASVYDDGLTGGAVPTVYWPLVVDGFWGVQPWTPRWFAFAVRTSRPDAASLLPEIRALVHKANPDVPIFAAQTLDRFARLSKLRITVTLSLLAIAALVATLLAAVGVYGVIAYSVGQRTREIGVRVALGAKLVNIQALVLGKGLVLTGLGIVTGLAGSLAVTRLMASLLFGVEPGDAGTYAAVTAGVALTAFAATWIPALVAGRVDPVSVLRNE